jgi:hypothetical protein
MTNAGVRTRATVRTVLAALSLTACATAPLTADTPKTVIGHTLPPLELHEECVRLAPGDRVDYSFDSSEPVAFNIHYHEGKAVVMPVSREASRADAGVFAPALAQHYCLRWEAGPAGALIDYRIRLRRAGT